MKKIQLFFFLIIPSITIIAQEYKFLKPDLDDSCTIIKHVLPENVEQEYLVYLDRKTWTKEKKEMADCSYFESQLKYTASNYKKLMNGTKPNLVNLKLPRYWYRPTQYKNELVIYKSNESSRVFVLTDSLLAMYEMGDFILTVFNKTSIVNNEYRINAIRQEYYTNDSKAEIIIHAIDKQKGLYLWEYKMDGKTRYNVMIPANKIANYPLINTLTSDAMVDIHIDTEPVDIDAILKMKK